MSENQTLIMNTFEGYCRSLHDSVAILKTALELNLTDSQVKEAIYG